MRRRGQSQVFWTETGIFSDLGQRRRADLFAVMETEGEVRPPGTLKFSVRSDLLLSVQPRRNKAAYTRLAFVACQTLTQRKAP